MTQLQNTQTLAEIQALAAQLAEIDDDMTQAVAGGAGSRKLPVGKTLARLVSYIEYGKQPQEYAGQVKDPALEFRLGFMLYSPGFANEDGTPYFMETFNISKSRNEKAGAFLLFKQMNYLGLAKNFAQLIGQAFILDIIDYKSKKAAADVAPRSIINTKLVMAPLDPISGAAYPVPEVNPADLHLFSWTAPTLAGWDKLFIDGTNDKGESKNWIQGTIVAATDFPGSPLESLLLANSRPIPAAKVQKSRAAPAAVGAAPVGALPTAGPAIVAPVAPVAPAVAVAPQAVAPVAATVPQVVVAQAPVVVAAPVAPAVVTAAPHPQVVVAQAPVVAPALPVAAVMAAPALV